MAEREGFDYRRYPQLPNETYTSMEPVLERVTSESQLPLVTSSCLCK